MRRAVVIILLVIAAFAAGVMWGRRPAVAPVKKAPLARKAVIPKKHRAVSVKLPEIDKKYKHPRVAVVMDDFGYNMHNLGSVLSMREQITLSILPNLRYSREIANLARMYGRETILHLPLEPHGEYVTEEKGTITTNMSETEILRALELALESVPGVRGVSNHMGSKATEDERVMGVIFKRLKKDKLYFLDSLTSEASVCDKAAAKAGIRYADRDIFLDNSEETDYIENQVLALRRIAFRRGQAIAVCHDRNNTMKVLTRMLPELADDGIEFVPLSELVN